MDDPVLAGFQTGFDFATGTGLVNGVSAMSAARVSQGDYNGNGVADAADYTVWRDRLGQSGLTVYTSADGNGDGQITQADYDVWKSHFGQTFPVPGSGSGTGSTLASMSQDSQGDVSSPASDQGITSEATATASVDHNLTAEPTMIAFANFTTVDLRSFHPVVASIGHSNVNARFAREARGTLIDKLVQNEDLLAWLSSRLPEDFHRTLDSGDDGSHDSSSGAAHHHSETNDTVFALLSSGVRSKNELLASLS